MAACRLAEQLAGALRVGGIFLVVRQIVEQIRERLGMHQAMLQRHVNDLFGSLFQNLIQDCADAAVVSANLLLGWPIRRLVLRRPVPTGGSMPNSNK